jgi:hypothetical protein
MTPTLAAFLRDWFPPEPKPQAPRATGPIWTPTHKDEEPPF